MSLSRRSESFHLPLRCSFPYAQSVVWQYFRCPSAVVQTLFTGSSDVPHRMLSPSFGSALDIPHLSFTCSSPVSCAPTFKSASLRPSKPSEIRLKCASNAPQIHLKSTSNPPHINFISLSPRAHCAFRTRSVWRPRLQCLRRSSRNCGTWRIRMRTKMARY